MDYRNCKVGQYHDFKVLASPYMNGSVEQVEVCKMCKERKVYTFTPDGKMINEHEYFLDHIRAFAQPILDDPGMMDVIRECNPIGLARMEKLAKEQENSEAFQADISDRFKFAMKKALNNEGWTDKTKDGIDRSSSEK